MNQTGRVFCYYVSLLFGLLFLNFLLFNVIPSDPSRIMLGPNADNAAVEHLRQEFGLNDPLIKQFTHYIQGLLSFDLGISYTTRRAVWPDVASSFKVTLLSSFSALLLATIYSIISAYISFVSKSGFRKFFTALNSNLMSVPSLVIAIVFGLFCIRWDLLSFAGTGDVRNILMSALVLTIYPSASLSQILLEQTFTLDKQPYIIEARSFGFTNSFIFWKRLLKNALLPWISQISNVVAILIGGAAVVEVVFSVPGIGRLLFQAVLRRDLPILQGILATVTSCFIIINILTEFVYWFLNPRKGEIHVV
ncbi:MAG: ABC transporter permease [Planctomycetia bacterium]|nr:ABC transporter permease [Planctomycetia bacterium]